MNDTKARPESAPSEPTVHTSFAAWIPRPSAESGLRPQTLGTDVYTQRLPTDLKQELMERQRASGLTVPEFLRCLLAVQAAHEGATAVLPPALSELRRAFEAQSRLAMQTLDAHLAGLAAAETLAESQASDLEQQLIEKQKRSASLEAELKELRANVARELSARRQDSATAEAAARLSADELRETRDTIRRLNASLAEMREQVEAFAGQREKLERFARERDEARTATARADLRAEEAEVKLARVGEDLVRAKRQLDENEALRMRQHQTAEEERKTLLVRAAAEKERLEATVERLQARMSEMTRESGR